MNPKAKGPVMIESLRKVMAENFGLDSNSINEFSNMENTEHWDSLKHMDLMMSIEEAFGVTFTADEIVSMTNFKKIQQVLNNKGIQ